MKFSERYGYKKVRDAVQFESMDDALRNGLWNLFHFRKDNSGSAEFLIIFWTDYLKKSRDEIPTIGSDFSVSLDYNKILRQPFYNSEWYEVFDILEFYCAHMPPSDRPMLFQNSCNSVFEKEMSAYRFIEGKITPIIDAPEIESIEEAINKSENPVGKHLKNALDKLSDRQAPDYRNSIKESISAVESQVKLMLGKTKGSLGELLAELEKRVGLHGALKKGFSAIYGYTSDKGGIRHALLTDDNNDFNDAKYMLVVCSAFINYLNGKKEALN